MLRGPYRWRCSFGWSALLLFGLVAVVLFSGAPKTRLPPSGNSASRVDRADTAQQAAVKTPNILRDAIQNHLVFNCSGLGVLKTLAGPRHLPEWQGTSGFRLEEDPDERKKSFEGIFSDGVWRGQKKSENPQGLAGSGRGSSLGQTVRIRATLNTVIPLIREYLGKDKIRILDIPCGDMTWMHQVIRSRTDVDYTGMDIVSKLVDSHNRFYQDVPHMNFVQGDIVARPLADSYDLVFTRQMTQHLTTRDALTVLKHISDSGSRFLMATNVPSAKRNTEIQIVIGDPKSKKADRRRYRPQNFLLPPYNLTQPLCDVLDITVGTVEHNQLWSLPLYA